MQVLFTKLEILVQLEPCENVLLNFCLAVNADFCQRGLLLFVLFLLCMLSL